MTLGAFGSVKSEKVVKTDKLAIWLEEEALVQWRVSVFRVSDPLMQTLLPAPINNQEDFYCHEQNTLNGFHV